MGHGCHRCGSPNSCECVIGRQKDETIPCKYCGDPTTYLGTKMCDPCFQLRSSLLYMKVRHPKVLGKMMKLLRKDEL